MVHLTPPRIRLIATLVLTLSYLPGVLLNGMWSDDYPSLVDPESIQIHASRDGRPVFGILLQSVFGLARNVGDLWAVRLIALIGLFFTCNLVLKQLLPKAIEPRILVSTLGAFSIASFQISVHWATAFVFTWVSYLSLLGFLLFVSNSWKRKLCGLFLLTISSLTYPILVFFFFPIIFLQWYENHGSWKKIKMDSFWGILGVSLSAIISFITNLILLKFRGLEFNDRVSIISLGEVISQAIWFTTHPFVLAFRGYSISSPEPLHGAIGFLIANLVILVGIFLKVQEYRRTLAIYLVLILFTLLSMTPLFFPNQQQIDVRYVATGTWLISYMLVSSLFGLLTRVIFKRKVLKESYLVVWLIVFFALSINHKYFTVIRSVYNETNSFISNAVSECDNYQILNGVLVVPRTKIWPSENYIGMFSQVTDLASSWVPLEAIKLEIRKIPSLRDADIPVTWYENGDSGCLVDLNLYSTSEN